MPVHFAELKTSLSLASQGNPCPEKHLSPPLCMLHHTREGSTCAERLFLSHTRQNLSTVSRIDIAVHGDSQDPNSVSLPCPKTFTRTLCTDANKRKQGRVPWCRQSARTHDVRDTGIKQAELDLRTKTDGLDGLGRVPSDSIRPQTSEEAMRDVLALALLRRGGTINLSTTNN